MSDKDILGWGGRVIIGAITCGMLLTKCHVYPTHKDDDAPQIEFKGAFARDCDTSYIPLNVRDSTTAKCYPEDNRR